MTTHLARLHKLHCVERLLNIGDFVFETSGTTLSIDFHELVFSIRSSDQNEHTARQWMRGMPC